MQHFKQDIALYHQVSSVPPISLGYIMVTADHDN